MIGSVNGINIYAKKLGFFKFQNKGLLRFILFSKNT